MACTVELALILSKRALTFDADPQVETVSRSLLHGFLLPENTS